MSVLAAAFNLNHAPHLVHWHFFQMSAPNIVVILLNGSHLQYRAMTVDQGP